MQEIVFNVIDARYRSGLPMIITTNLELKTIKNPDTETHSRIYDRILERCFPIEVKGTSHRRKNVNADYKQMKELLGLD
jgi:DNA replication protein DnaC